jgi:diguanylate cyclase (GGDEF)-like protein/PAS domain S-box-containing protein
MIKLQLHVLIYFIIFLCASTLFFLAWPRRKTSGGNYFIAHLISLDIWAIGLFFEAISLTQSTKVLWSQISYFGVVSIAPLLLLFVLNFTKQSQVKRSIVISLFIIPFLVLVAAWTNQWHHLLWPRFYWGSREYNVLIYGHGLIFYINLIYIYFIITIGLMALIQAIPKNQPPFRSQLIVILVAVFFPVISGIMYTFKLEPVRGMDISIFGFLLTNLILSFGFVRYQLLDLVPVARDALFKHMQDGIIVVDWMKRIVEVNKNAIELLNIPQDGLLGRPLDTVLPWQLNLPALSLKDLPEERTLDKPNHRHINIQVSSLAKGNSAPPGYLLVLRDISAMKKSALELQKANQDLKAQLMQINHLQIMLKDQAAHDSLTGLFNRRAMDEALEDLINQAHSQKVSLSIAILDIDHFKRFNDIYGHQTGDFLLREYSKIIQRSIRKHDIACRFGGDEILIAFIDMSLENVVIKADEIRQALKKIEIEESLSKVTASVSIGVAAYPVHGTTIKELIRSADQALYTAKEKGRNQVIQAPLPATPES